MNKYMRHIAAVFLQECMAFHAIILMQGSAAPEFDGIYAWLNTKEPVSLKKQRGRVVLVDFWTYSCVNCVRTLPHLAKWNRKYRSKGLTVIGVHSPEFGFEKDVRNVKTALKKRGVRYPVAVDNQMKTWEAFNNKFWPCRYIIDAKGKIRHVHAGEGAYVETELWITKLLLEAGGAVKSRIEKTERPSYNINTTLEIRCGNRKNVLGNVPHDGVYADAGSHDTGKIYLDGRWVQDNECLEGVAGGRMTVTFRAKSLNVVASPVGASAKIRVFVDGKPLDRSIAGDDANPKDGTVRIDRPDIYSIYRRKEFGTHEIKITAEQPAKFFAFTFG